MKAWVSKVTAVIVQATLVDGGMIAQDCADGECGNGPDLWVNLQAHYDLDRVSREMSAELADIPTLHAA